MKILAIAPLWIGLASAIAQTSNGDFANAQWIAMDADSTILFPHKHLLKASSPEGRSLKAYELPVLTKAVRLRSGKVKRAWVDICGLGQYELFINGRKVGDHFLSPGWTMYDKRLLYNELDVTEHLLEGYGSAGVRGAEDSLSIKVMLGGGMYDIPLKGYHKMGGSCGAPKLLFCLHITYADGTMQTVVSDVSWQAEPSPVRYSSIYAGEWHDAGYGDGHGFTRLNTDGADDGKGATRFQKGVVVTSPRWDVPLVKQQAGTFVKVKQELPFTPLPPQLHDSTTSRLHDSPIPIIYDMGQNCSGIVRLKVRGQRGQNIRLHPAEVLKDGKVYQRCMPGYEWRYTLSGCADGETWQPQFTYTGFRYVEAVADEGVELLELTGLHTTTDAPEVGSFECSDTLLNQIHTLIDWAIRSNLVSITTDCPTREKLGWQEQNHLMACSMMYRYDMRALMNKIADDMADSQHADGAIPTIAPEYTLFDKGSGFEDTPEWGASFILCPWYTYRWYGDDTAMRRHYDAMKQYIAYLQGRTADGILDYGLGDWYDLGPNPPGFAQLTSVALTATAIYYYELCTMGRIAAHLGEEADAAQYAALASDVKEAFNRRFATSDGHVYENGSQTGLAMALCMDLVNDSTRQPALDALVRDIEQRGYALTAGDVGFRYVVQALQRNGRSDIIYRMNHNDSVPGYAYQIKQGATALTESWQAYYNVSNNHLMLGHLMEWLYSGLGGISLPHHAGEEGTPAAWQHIVIAPQMVGDVTWAKTSLNTPRGEVSCYWTKKNSAGSWTIAVVIPKGADAEVCLPDGRCMNVGEGSHFFKQ